MVELEISFRLRYFVIMHNSLFSPPPVVRRWGIIVGFIIFRG